MRLEGPQILKLALWGPTYGELIKKCLQNLSAFWSKSLDPFSTWYDGVFSFFFL